jgi:tRNA nucleotidyltransferase (CCA-adding enzyme)
MRNRLHKLPQEIKDLIYLASNIATENNMPVYLVGGFVRDLLLEVKNLDLDFVIEGDGIKFAEDLATILKARLIRHRRFGTATIVLNPVRVITSFSRLPIVSRGVKIDIATARRETYPRPASLPLVTRGTLEDDLARRDFSVNAMAISITKKDFGKLVDFFCGKDDLQHKKVRILHSLSFIDDPTRMLRAIRFEQRYNFKIEPHTLKLLKVAAAIKMLEKVQPQRLRDELILILKEAHP